MYMAPEVYLSQPYNEKADVFSIGVVIFEMFSGCISSHTVGACRRQPQPLFGAFLPCADVCCAAVGFARQTEVWWKQYVIVVELKWLNHRTFIAAKHPMQSNPTECEQTALGQYGDVGASTSANSLTISQPADQISIPYLDGCTMGSNCECRLRTRCYWGGTTTIVACTDTGGFFAAPKSSGILPRH